MERTKKEGYNIGAQKGNTPWNNGLPKEVQPWYGKHHSEETKQKISEKKKGIRNSIETEFKLGMTLPQEWIDKITKYNKENPNSGQFKKGHIPENKFEKGSIPWNKGNSIQSNTGRTHFKKGMTPWNKDIIFDQIKQENHWNWKGGITGTGYPKEWINKLRSEIRERDNYTCQECGKKQGKHKLDIHHIDGIKININHDNLIALCRSCHIKKHRSHQKRDEIDNDTKRGRIR